MDNTGRIDCTEALCKLLDDILIRQVIALKETHDKLVELSENKTFDTYIGVEGGRVQNGVLSLTFPEFEPSAKIVYFPKGTYLVSDTITYALKNLKQYWYFVLEPYLENNRQIHFLGESKEGTIIRLQDGAKGFEKGNQKPLISFVNRDDGLPRHQEYTNVAFQNTIEDITLDCGNNPGAIGIKYVSSNCGRIENVSIKAEQGDCGIYVDQNTTQAVFTRISVSGFDYGVDVEHSNLMILEDLDLSGNKKAGIYTLGSSMIGRKIATTGIPTILFKECDDDPWLGRYYLIGSDIVVAGNAPNQEIIVEDGENSIRGDGVPFNSKSESQEDWAFVDDFGAIGDGKTDSTRAIQKAMNSGKPYIAFGEGEYLIDAKIKIPKTVKGIDFLYSSLACGSRLVGGEYDAPFEVSEDSEEILFIENLSAWEHFKGHIRLIKHAAKRDLVIRNIHLMSASLYFNSVPGSKVFFDNCFLTTGTYTTTAWLPGNGFVPVYSHIVPLEAHGQNIYGRLVNLERADLAMVNDNSQILLDGYRTEAWGTALRAVNGGSTTCNLFNAGIGRKIEENAVFDICDSSFTVELSIFFGCDYASEYNILISNKVNGEQQTIAWDDAKSFIKHGKVIRRYTNTK